MAGHSDAHIAKRAYEIWEREGRPQGREQQHWDEAATEIDGEAPERPDAGPESPGNAKAARRSSSNGGRDRRVDISAGDEPPVDELYERSRDTPGAFGETIPAATPKRPRKTASRADIAKK